MICILVQFGKLIASLINSVEANHREQKLQKLTDWDT